MLDTVEASLWTEFVNWTMTVISEAQAIQFRPLSRRRIRRSAAAEGSNSVPSKSNNLAEWVTDWVRNFSPYASSAMEVAKEMKFDTKVA